MMRNLDQSHVDQFESQLARVKQLWDKNLSSLGVKWPSSKVKQAQLVGLSFFIGEPVNKDSLGWYVGQVAGGAADTQARHLRSDGWAILLSGRGEPHSNTLASGERMPRGSYALASLAQPDATFLRNERLTREGRAGAKDWHELCVLYKGKCAHCGATTKNPDKGHMDPNKPATVDNLIPLCVPCNNWAANDVIFGPDGRIVAVRSERFLKAADKAAQQRIADWLAKQ
ncbi:hypothetical protein [Altererythrobacter palmitatis]|uniref:HNH endonuclease n=2 Tax=Alteraurantiacibacter palmitatis TaxID=2054628 RepID=A0ABV7E273_9SPHN